MPLRNDFAGIKSWMTYISNSIRGTLRTDNTATMTTAGNQLT